jgi:hypothetical protein
MDGPFQIFTLLFIPIMDDGKFLRPKQDLGLYNRKIHQMDVGTMRARRYDKRNYHFMGKSSSDFIEPTW